MIDKTRFAIGACALSATGLIGILSYEGYSSEAYIPVPGDKVTIGFGTTDGVKLGDTITPEKAIERAYTRSLVGRGKFCVCEPCVQHRNVCILLKHSR